MSGDAPITVRSAAAADVPAIGRIIDACAAEGAVLPRQQEDVHAAIHSFVVAERAGEILGCCALATCGPATGEVRSVAIAAAARGHGVGRLVVDYVATEAMVIGLERLFLLTRIPAFFTRLGFREIDPENLPDSFLADIVHVQRRSLFNKVVMTRTLRTAPLPTLDEAFALGGGAGETPGRRVLAENHRAALVEPTSLPGARIGAGR